MAVDLVVVTPEGEAFAEPVEQVVLPGAEGEFGVLESHENFLAPLRPGALEIRSGGGPSEWAAVSAGFAEVSASRVVVLVDECVRAEEIDIDDARALESSTRQALDALEPGVHSEAERLRLEDALLRANVLIEVHGRRQA